MSDILEGLMVILTIDFCLVAEKLRGRLLIIKQATQQFDMQRFNLKKLNGAEIKEWYQVKISKQVCKSGKCGW
jgi:hypothetical protein